MTKKEIISAVKISILSLALVLGVSSIYAWTGPASAPPGGNVAAPLNAGNDAQPKGGGLLLNSAGGAYGLIVYKGLVGIGTAAPGAKLEVVGGPIKATGGLIIETRNDDPDSPETGRMWLRTDI